MGSNGSDPGGGRYVHLSLTIVNNEELWGF